MKNDLKNTIFISYRRKDTASAAGRLHDFLEREFGADMVFKDIHDIGLGTDFRDAIAKTLMDCKVFLALIGDRYVSLTDAEGNIRIMNPNDYVNIEVSTALDFKDQKLVIPILINGARMPNRDQIPKSMEAITWQNAKKLSEVSPPKMPKIDELKDQIGDGKTEKVIDILLPNQDLDEDIRTQLLMLKSRLSALKKKERMGTISNEKIDQTNNQINYSLLQILDDLS